MKYVVFRSGGKQYKAVEGEELLLEHLPFSDGAKSIALDDILLYVSEDVRKIGSPRLSDVVVKATVLAEVKGDKVRVMHFHAKSRHRRVMGHRQFFSKVRIDTIAVAGQTDKIQDEKEKPKTEGKTSRSRAKKT